jgi:effector-binding domain-containing protein
MKKKLKNLQTALKSAAKIYKGPVDGIYRALHQLIALFNKQM